MISGSSCYRL